MLYFGAALSLLLFLTPLSELDWVQLVASYANGLGIPITSSLFSAAMIALAASITIRRKAIIWWGLIVYFVLLFVTNISTLWLNPATLTTTEAPATTVEVVLNLVVAFANLVALWLLFWGRSSFTARLVRGAWRGALLTLVGGLAVVSSFGFMGARLFRGGLASADQAARWVVLRLLGNSWSPFPKETLPAGPLLWGETISIAAMLVLIATIVIFLRGSGEPGSTREEDLAVRRFLAEYPEDSLGYYATRTERAIVFAPSGKAAISYAVSGGAAVAASDPLGDPNYWNEAIEAWLDVCFENGWAPGALSVSTKGAQAYRQAGFNVHMMGDEAIIHTDTFDATSSQMRALMQSVRRAHRHGVEIEVRRLDQIPIEEVAQLRQAAAAFRQGEERGFTMSLDRILEAEDARQVVVTARKDDELHCLLTFVPWGRNGLSLNLMRRNRESVNGIVEACVVALIEHGRDTGISRISLNFAMFRQLFVLGEAVNASWWRRLVLAFMRFGSRFWQLESLYESNARYQPEWFPRYLAFRHSSQGASVLLASARLEGFLPSLGLRIPSGRLWEIDDAYLQDLQEIEETSLEEAMARFTLSEQEQGRRTKAELLASRGRDPYPAAQEEMNNGSGLELQTIELLAQTLQPGEVAKQPVLSSGRIRSCRRHGGVVFCDLYHRSEKLQIIFSRDRLSEADWDDLKLLDLGDLVTVAGEPARSRTGQISLAASKWKLNAKCLRPLPAVGTRLEAQTSARFRTLQLLQTPDALDNFYRRCQVLASIRRTLSEAAFTEVETPMLHAVKGGANARPFITRMNAYSTDVYLRIAPELYLKRLLVAGMQAIFEMGRSFRNEGADATHNPEFTSLEAYRVGADYHDMRMLTETLIKRAAVDLYGREICLRPVTDLPAAEVIAQIDGVDLAEFDLSGPWPVIPVLTAISQAVGQEITTETSAEELLRICTAHDLPVPPLPQWGELIGVLYDELVEANTIAPTFYIDFPVSTSPLTRRSRSNPDLAERWDLVAFGMELGTAYTELTDPRDQRLRFTAQSLAAAAGDAEAMSIDEDFLRSLDLGMPPTGGLGLGVDRLVMLLTGTNIRQTLAFPFVRNAN
ncbi:lysine--tRNA ligase [Boudabousia tangfeifanii]|uniref:Lysine--tRNA ligase n=2 Tax=Boudabousia tangfeifanii TaxID=1912795 RepID=A0A1D9MMV4_9ACTO|nr:lysine--tRNA ligase [Boudabousia tangfeifanii]